MTFDEWIAQNPAATMQECWVASRKAMAVAGEPSPLALELQSVATRHGRALVDFVVRLAAANVAMDQLLEYAQTHSRVRPIASVLVNTWGDICAMASAANGWTGDDVIECMGDISRARQIANPGGVVH